MDDPVLPHCSIAMAYDLARETKRLSNCKGEGHGLDESAKEVHREVLDWIGGKLDGKYGENSVP